MKTLKDIENILKKFEIDYNIPISDAKQGSSEWFTLKLGVISSSNVSKVVSKKGSETRFTYMAELISQVCTGDMEELNSKYLDWGKHYEDAARSSYEFETGYNIAEVPFVFKDDMRREGCSPDGIVNDKKGVEIKCPFNATHFIKFLTEDKIKPEYEWQYQHTLRVMDADEWDFVQYHPNMKISPLKILTVKKDEEKQKIMDEAIPEFIFEMDSYLKKIGIKFGDQWLRIGAK